MAVTPLRAPEGRLGPSDDAGHGSLRYSAAAPEPEHAARSALYRRWVALVHDRLEDTWYALRRLDLARMAASLCVLLVGFSTGWALRHAGPAGFVIMIALLAVLFRISRIGQQTVRSMTAARAPRMVPVAEPCPAE